MSWVNDRFGVPNKDGRRRVSFSVRIRYGMRDENWSEYRSDLARFPNDPQAYCNGPAAKKKLIDQRKREGWTTGPSYQDIGASFDAEKKVDSEALVREAYDRAEATGFRDEGGEE